MPPQYWLPGTALQDALHPTPVQPDSYLVLPSAHGHVLIGEWTDLALHTLLQDTPSLCSGSLQAAPVCFPHLLLLWPHGSETSVPKLVAYPHPLPASIDRLVRVSTPEGSTQSLLNPSLEKQTLCLPRSREIPFTKPTPPSLACQSPYPIIKGKLPVLRQQTLQVSHLAFS